MNSEEKDRWRAFLGWAHERKYVVNLYRPKNPDTIYFDYRIQLRLKGIDKVFLARAVSMGEAISEIKNQLLAFRPGELG